MDNQWDGPILDRCGAISAGRKEQRSFQRWKKLKRNLYAGSYELKNQDVREPFTFLDLALHIT